MLVVEGYMDVIALAQFGIRHVCATLGTATTPEHLERLFRIVPEVVFCFDGDRAGREAAWRALDTALPIMREGRQIRFMFLPEGEDPDTRVRAVGQAGFEADMARALPFSEFFFQHLTKQADTTSIDGRAQLVELARPLLKRLPPGVFYHMMRDQLAQLGRIEPADLDRLLSSQPKNSPAPADPAFRQKSRPSGKRQPLTPVRIALMRLLYHPGLATQAGDPHRFEGMAVAGIDLLIQVLETLQARPHLNSSALLERWRDSEYGPHLEKLMAWAPELDDKEALEAEFLGALAQLDLQRLEHRYDFLLSRSNQGELSQEEKRELKELFATLNRDKRRESPQNLD